MGDLELGTLWWIGGSPCAGKSSIAALLAARHGLTHVECDAGADARRARMSGRGLPAYDELTALSTGERLAREPAWQSERELAFYREQFEFMLAELETQRTAVVEGADLLPDLLESIEVRMDHAVWVVPSPEFQWRRYSARDWVDAYVSECADPETAFANWMRRDALFAEHVRQGAEQRGGAVIVVDGTTSVEENARRVEQHFGW